MGLRQDIEQLYDQDPESIEKNRALQLFNEFKFFLNRGEIRAAEKMGDDWRAHSWVQKGIILGFRLGVLTDASINEQFRFFEKNTFPLKNFSLENGVQIVPGGSAVRDGMYMGRGVVCMPPMYADVGAYIDTDARIESHVLVGACAQLGKNVCVGAGTLLGGVLHPVGALPVIIEDEVTVGGSCGIFHGVVVQKGAVIVAGVLITESTTVYDVARGAVYRREGHRPLVIPEGAVVMPGSKRLDEPWAASEGLSVAAPVILHYRKESPESQPGSEEGAP
jgi:2,3,4,5-tetrahydropyridine-2-carboxylate N-succinyltransferase